jgi:LAO/AO transport system kinase
MTELAQRIRRGDRRAIARALTAVENGEADALLDELQPHTGQAYIVGVTGAPGTGKSTLVTAMVVALREAEQTVAVLAVDPTSPFSGGALLGDRVRMARTERRPWGVYPQHGQPGGARRFGPDNGWRHQRT